MRLAITVPGDPRGQPRPRFANLGKFVQVYDPDKELNDRIKAAIASQFEGEPTTEPVEVSILFYMPLPKAASKKNKALMLENAIKHTKKYDIDNLVVKILNCMSKIIYVDDNQVWQLEAKKLYSETPRTEIALWW